MYEVFLLHFDRESRFPLYLICQWYFFSQLHLLHVDQLLQWGFWTYEGFNPSNCDNFSFILGRGKSVQGERILELKRAGEMYCGIIENVICYIIFTIMPQYIFSAILISKILFPLLIRTITIFIIKFAKNSAQPTSLHLIN